MGTNGICPERIRIRPANPASLARGSRGTKRLKMGGESAGGGRAQGGPNPNLVVVLCPYTEMQK